MGVDQGLLEETTKAVFKHVEKTIRKKEFNLRNVKSGLQKEIKKLREAYEEQKPPNFSTPMSRLAYFIHYHPFHMIASIVAVKQFERLLQPILNTSSVSAIDLGCGPGAVSIGIDTYKKTFSENPKGIIWDYIDKELAWARLISTQRHNKGGHISKTVWPFDLSRPGTNYIEPLQKVVSQKKLIASMGLITELDFSKDNRLIHLIQNCSAGTYVFLGDIKNKSTKKSSLLIFEQNLKNFKKLKYEPINFTVEKNWIQNKLLNEIYSRNEQVYQKRNLSFDFLLLQKLK